MPPTSALVLRIVPYGEADAVATLFTERLGRVSAMARRARAASARTNAKLVLEPMHGLSVRLEERAGVELLTLRESALETPRLRLTKRLGALEAAGTALRWMRDATPPHLPEPELWSELTGFLDALDAEPMPAAPNAILAAAGLRFLGALGYGLQLDACVACGKPCPTGSAALLDPVRGGVVCRACGGGSRLVRPELRAAMERAMSGGNAVFDDASADLVLGLVEAALSSHHATAPKRRSP